MSIAHATDKTPFGAATLRRLDTVATMLAERIRTWRETRRTVAMLRGLSREQLEDIGLTRADIERFAETGQFPA